MTTQARYKKPKAPIQSTPMSPFHYKLDGSVFSPVVPAEGRKSGSQESISESSPQHSSSPTGSGSGSVSSESGEGSEIPQRTTSAELYRIQKVHEIFEVDSTSLFEIPGSKYLYNVGLHMIRGKPYCSFTKEKQIRLKGLKDNSTILDLVQTPTCIQFTVPPRTSCPTMSGVLCIIQGRTRASQNFPKPLQAPLDFVIVCVVSIDINTTTTNRFSFWVEYRGSRNTMEFDQLMYTIKKKKMWIARAIYQDTPVFLLTVSSAIIYKRDLTFKAKFWWSVVMVLLYPRKVYNTFTTYRAILIATIISRILINMANIMGEDMQDTLKMPHQYPYSV